MKLISILFISTALSIAGGVNITKGETSPEINLPDTNGNLSSLSELRGNIVLIDFWASWCAPCRKKHPELVNLYNTYSEVSFKGGEEFEIFSVSLDKNKESWLSAISKDELDWTNHVSDLKGWESQAAKTYNIRSIPSNVLLDAEGVIIGTNYSSAELAKVLDSLK